MIPASPFSSFSIGPLTVHIYGICIALALLLCYTLALKIAKRHEIEEQEFDRYFFISLIAAFLGARIYHLAANWWYYQNHLIETVMIWNGGLGIYGGIIAACISLYILTKKNNRSFFQITDILAIVLPLGQALGRWGNYFNQELFGYPSNLPWALKVSPAFRPDEFKQNPTFHPTFLYESLLNSVNFLLLYFLYTRKKLPSKTTTALYFINYGIIRFIVDLYKIDPDPHYDLGPFTISQWVSLLVLIIGITIILFNKKLSQQSRG